MAAISQTTFSRTFSWMKMYEFRLRFHWSLFLRVQLTISQHWFRLWLTAVQATSHYLKQYWLVYWRIDASLGLNELTSIVLAMKGNRSEYLSLGIENGHLESPFCFPIPLGNAINSNKLYYGFANRRSHAQNFVDNEETINRQWWLVITANQSYYPKIYMAINTFDMTLNAWHSSIWL